MEYVKPFQVAPRKNEDAVEALEEMMPLIKSKAAMLEKQYLKTSAKLP